MYATGVGRLSPAPHRSVPKGVGVGWGGEGVGRGGDPVRGKQEYYVHVQALIQGG